MTARMSDIDCRLTESERERIALMLSDALMPYGQEFNAERAARLIEARLERLLAERQQLGHAEGFAEGLKWERECKQARCNAPDCTRAAGHMGAHR